MFLSMVDILTEDISGQSDMNCNACTHDVLCSGIVQF